MSKTRQGGPSHALPGHFGTAQASQLLPAVLRLLVSQRLQWSDQAPQLDGQPLLTPLILDDNGLLTTA